MIFYVLSSLVITATSFLGLGLLSTVLSGAAMILVHLFAQKPLNPIARRFLALYKMSLVLHLGVYLFFIVKLFFISGFSDIPAFIVSHLIIHHFMSAFIGATLMVMGIRIYNAQCSTTPTNE